MNRSHHLMNHAVIFAFCSFLAGLGNHFLYLDAKIIVLPLAVTTAYVCASIWAHLFDLA